MFAVSGEQIGEYLERLQLQIVDVLDEKAHDTWRGHGDHYSVCHVDLTHQLAHEAKHLSHSIVKVVHLFSFGAGESGRRLCGGLELVEKLALWLGHLFALFEEFFLPSSLANKNIFL